MAFKYWDREGDRFGSRHELRGFGEHEGLQAFLHTQTSEEHAGGEKLVKITVAGRDFGSGNTELSLLAENGFLPPREFAGKTREILSVVKTALSSRFEIDGEPVLASLRRSLIKQFSDSRAAAELRAWRERLGEKPVESAKRRRST